MLKNSTRFFIEPKNIHGSKIIIKNKEFFDQINKVLRLKVDDQIIVLDNKEFQVVLKEKGRGVIKGDIVSERENESESEIALTLYQSLIKKDKFEWVLQKGTELGVKKFVPVVSERSVKIIDKIPERWFKIIREAAEQSGRGKLPTIENVISFEKAVKNILGESYIADYEGDPPSLLDSSELRRARVNLFIGPEGGFSEKELVLALKCGIIKVSLGKTVLRSETAGVVGSGLFLI